MSHNWNYVIAGYAIVTSTLIGYGAWLRVKLRRARRSVPEESGD